MPPSSISFLQLPFELREHIYQDIFSTPQSVTLKWSSFPSSRRKVSVKPSIRHSGIMGMRNACRITRMETSSYFFTKTVFILDLDTPRPIDSIYAFIRTFGVENTNTIASIGFHWKSQCAKGRAWQSEFVVGFDMRQISYWASKFPALRRLRLVCPKLSCLRWDSTRPLLTPAAINCAMTLLKTTRLFIETQHTMGPDRRRDVGMNQWQDLGSSVHEYLVIQMDDWPEARQLWLTMAPFDENSWEIASMYSLQ